MFAFNLGYQTLCYCDGTKEVKKILEKMNEHFEKMPSGNYMVKPNFKSQYAFFEGLFGYTKEAGFDFVKIDFQGPQFLGYKGSENAVYAHTQTTKALEAVCKDNNFGWLLVLFDS